MHSVTGALGVFCLGVLIGFTSAACGGGGGGGDGGGAPTPTSDAFDGTYFWHVFEGEVGPPLDNGSYWGTVTANGLQGVTGASLSGNDAGSIIAPYALPGFGYTIDADRRLAWEIASIPEGGISVDGRVATVIPTAEDVPPAVSVLLRRVGAFTTADLAGTYHACAIFSVVGVDASWFAGTITFDAAGNATYSSGVNTNGIITYPAAPVPYGTASVAADGTVTWASPTPQIVWTGGMLQGGELAVFSGTTQATDAQFMIVLIRQGVGLSNATFQGSYHVVSIGAQNTPPPRYGATTGAATADGAGTFTVQTATLNLDGVVTVGGPLPALPYIVGAGGTLDMAGGGLSGAVSPSGDFAVFAGGTTPLSSPALWFLHR